jgi:hypothetical protein
MNPNYTYAADDGMNPVYCIGCRQHIPQDLSNQGRGLCPVCVGKVAPAAPPVASAMSCPNCRSTALNNVEEPNGLEALKVTLYVVGGLLTAFGVLMICLYIGIFMIPVGLAMLIGAVFVPTKRKARLCGSCGYRFAS